MNITIYNTSARVKQSFTTLELGKVMMYCCGVTVYDDCHLGHARSELEVDPIWIESRLQQRQQARQEKRYTESDRIRDELLVVGITPIERPDGQTRYSINK